MAVNKIVYDGRTLIDLTNDTVSADTLAEGVTAHSASGELVTGTMSSGGGGTDTSGANATTYDVLSGVVAYGAEGKIVGEAPFEYAGRTETPVVGGVITLPRNMTWWDAAYGNGKYIIVPASGSSNGALSSADGLSWSITELSTYGAWYAIECGNNRFVALKYDSAVGSYSDDGDTWNTFDLPFSARWNNLAYGGGRFVALASYSWTGAYSEDGISWTEFTMPHDSANGSSGFSGLTYGDGRFVVHFSDYVSGSGFTYHFAYSTDGINWTKVAAPDDLAMMAYGNGRFVAVQDWSNYAVYSTDGGVTWTEVTLPLDEAWTSICYGDGKFVVVSYDSNKVLYSSNGVDWYSTTVPIEACSVVYYANGRFVATGYDIDYAVYSDDGINWSNKEVSVEYSYTYGVARDTEVYLKGLNGETRAIVNTGSVFGFADELTDDDLAEALTTQTSLIAQIKAAVEAKGG